MRLTTARLAAEIVRMERVTSEYDLFDRLREVGISEYEAIEVIDMEIFNV